MANNNGVDYYEVLPGEPECGLGHDSPRVPAPGSRFHPDNRESGNEGRFRELTDAYDVLGNAERRARYDVTYHQQRKDRLRLVSGGAQSEDDFAIEQAFRLTLLEALYTRGAWNLDRRPCTPPISKP